MNVSTNNVLDHETKNESVWLLPGEPLDPTFPWYDKNSGVKKSPIEYGTRPGRSAGTFGFWVLYLNPGVTQPNSPVALTLNAMIKAAIEIRFMIHSE
jgi:hypothetical protein